MLIIFKSYHNYLQLMDESLEIINWLKSGKYRVPMLNELLSPKSPSELAGILNINRASVSRIIKDLTSKKLIDCTESGAKTKLCIINEKGKHIIKLFYDIVGGG